MISKFSNYFRPPLRKEVCSCSQWIESGLLFRNHHRIGTVHRRERTYALYCDGIEIRE